MLLADVGEFQTRSKNQSEDVNEGKDAIRTRERRWNNGIAAVPTDYKPNVIFIDVVQT